MKTIEAVFVTDQVNKHNYKIPVEGLAESIEGLASLAAAAGIPIGTPGNVGHNMHRAAGWSVPVGLLMTGEMARLMGLMYLPEGPVETKTVLQFRQRFLRQVSAREAEPYAEELRSRIPAGAAEGAVVGHRDAAVIEGPRLAAALFPQFFDVSSPLVDKDGLTDYRALLRLTKQVQPGVFHEPKADLLLFAHPFLRRDLSRANTLNEYLFRSIDGAAAANSELQVRLRLDPDMVGHPASAKGVIELEYWRGPKFNDDIAAIPAGATVHKASERTRFFEGVDRTEFWWKEPEMRAGDAPASIRTFEAEEIVEDPSRGDAGERYGCRYMHAEYDVANGVISHFDGAIRQYEGDAYLTRLDASIDRAGKHSIYTKLFRFDGALPVRGWKGLASDYFRGNDLIGEYLGGTAAPADPEEPAEDGPTSPTLPVLPAPSLAVLVAYKDPDEQEKGLEPAEHELEGVRRVRCVEVVVGKLGEWVARRTPPDVPLMVRDGAVANLPHIHLGPSGEAQAEWASLGSSLSDAMVESVAAGELESVSISVGWSHGDALVGLSFGGEATRVRDLLKELLVLVRPAELPSSWIAPVNDVVARMLGPAVHFEHPLALFGGDRIRIPRAAAAEKVRFLARSEHARQILLGG